MNFNTQLLILLLLGNYTQQEKHLFRKLLFVTGGETNYVGATTRETC